MKREYAFKLIKEIIKEYKDGSEEPLDGDEVDRLIEHLRNKINLFEGNITPQEYDKLKALERFFSRPRGSGIIYTGTRRKTEKVAQFLYEFGLKADFYHAGMETT